MQTAQVLVDSLAARVNELKAEHAQLANVLRDLRGEDSEGGGGDEASPRGRSRARAPRQRKRAGHVGAATPELGGLSEKMLHPNNALSTAQR